MYYYYTTAPSFISLIWNVSTCFNTNVHTIENENGRIRMHILLFVNSIYTCRYVVLLVITRCVMCSDTMCMQKSECKCNAHQHIPCKLCLLYEFLWMLNDTANDDFCDIYVCKYWDYCIIIKWSIRWQNDEKEKYAEKILLLMSLLKQKTIDLKMNNTRTPRYSWLCSFELWMNE